MAQPLHDPDHLDIHRLKQNESYNGNHRLSYFSYGLIIVHKVI